MSARSNADVAAVFAEMGDLLLIQGGDPYRARAFSRSAQVIARVREPLSELLSHGRLERLAGIGAGSAERIKQILRTGTCPEHARLVARVPPGLRAVLKVRGMGPATTRLVFSQLGVTDLASLEAAARSGALARARGIGGATADRVLAHLEDLARKPAQKLLLSEALALGDRIVAWLKDDPACNDALQTGSARRREVMIGDLDFVAGARDAAAVARRFAQFPDVREVVSGADGFCIVLLKSGVQADLRIVEPECFGAGVHHFTGNKQHNISLRLYAHRMGLHVSEKGVWERKLRGKGRGDANRKIARRIASGRTEEELFSALRLPFIPVELRTGGDEIESALRGALPHLVEEREIKGDLHLACTDPDQAVLLAQAAQARGLSYGAFVIEHDVLARQEGREIVRALRAHETRQRSAFAIFVAVRARIDEDGGVDVSEPALRLADFVLAEPPASSDGVDPTVAVERALASGRIDVLARPTLRALPDRDSARTDLWRVLRAAAAAGVAVEVGGDPSVLDLDGEGCAAARQLGVRVTLGSRARNPAELLQLRFALWQARRGALSAGHALNTQEATELRAVLSRRGRAPRGERGDERGDRPTDRSALAARLRGPLDDALRSRLEKFLRGETDPELALALREDHASPLQAAFELLARAP